MEVKGKNVVVIGGLGGIGSSLCETFLKKQISKLAILDIRENDEFCEQLRNKYPKTDIIFIRTDITKTLQVGQNFKKIIEKFQFIDIFINSCGILKEDEPVLTINTNLTGLITITLRAIDCMSKSNGGRGGFIGNISSIGAFKALPYSAVYCASKYGVLGFTRSIANDKNYEVTGITINTFCPGATKTELTEKRREGKTTFSWGSWDSGMTVNKTAKVQMQTPSECAECLITAIETNKNGAVWIIRSGELSEIDLTNPYTICQ